MAGIALGVALVGGCAYFNTFYNAREHFKKAERAQRTQSAQVQQGTEPGPSAAAIREYDLTIDKCNKVIQEHSDSRWVDDAILLMGRAYYGKREYTQALDKFLALIEGFPESGLRHEGMFMAGLAYFRLNRREEGRNQFEVLLREKPGFERRDEMLRIEAEAFERDGELEQAIAIYRRIVDEYPESDERVQTLFDIGELYMRTGVFDSAYVAFDAALGSADSIDDRLEARKRRADALFREKRYAEALDTYRTVLDIGTKLTRAEIEPIELRIAACINELGDHDRAIEEYRHIAEVSSGDVAAAEAIFNIGLIRELDYGDYRGALDEYADIKRLTGAGARSIFATQADSRSRHLQRLIDRGITSREASTGEDAAAGGQLLLAEQLLYQQQDTTSAIAKYAAVERGFPDTPEGRKACYARAYLSDLTAVDPESTRVLYLHTLTRYPGTPQAIAAGDRLTAKGLEHLIPEGALEPAAPDSASADSLGRAGEIVDEGDAAAVGRGLPGEAARDSLGRPIQPLPGRMDLLDGRRPGLPADTLGRADSTYTERERGPAPD